MDLYEALTTTSATRRFSERSVPESLVHRVLDVARYAPSGGNRQGWRVVVVKDPAKRRAIRDLYLEPWKAYAEQRRPLATTARRIRALNAADEMANNLHKVPVHLVVCVELAALSITDAALDRPSIVGGGSIYPFVHNILLACTAEGLGSAITTLLCVKEPETFALLGIPEGYAMAALVPIGYREGDAPRKLSRKPVNEIATVDGFDGPPLTVGGR
jgi:nitroreductase